MSASLRALRARIDAAERETRDADAALRETATRLRHRASRVASYRTPASVVVGLLALLMLGRAFRRPVSASVAAVPAGAGLLALVIRIALPSLLVFFRRQAASYRAARQTRQIVQMPDRS